MPSLSSTARTFLSARYRSNSRASLKPLVKELAAVVKVVAATRLVVVHLAADGDVVGPVEVVLPAEVVE